MNITQAKRIKRAIAQGGNQKAAGAALGISQSNFCVQFAQAREEFPELFIGMEPKRGRHAKPAAPASRASAGKGAAAAQRNRARSAAAVKAVEASLPDPSAAVAEDERVPEVSGEELLRRRVRILEKQCAAYRDELLSDREVREVILGLAAHTPAAPEWLSGASALTKRTKEGPGVPILMASDWHWGEVVRPSEVGGVNEFNLEIARERAKKLITSTVDLLTNHMVCPNYPGLVLALGGDFVSGNIHDELSETNAQPIMPVVLDIVDVLTGCILELKRVFGRLLVPAVTGNHSRLHRKPRSKEYNFNSFDWLIYQMLARRFAGDRAVVFQIPDGPDHLFKVFNHRYLLTHGNQFRGGDGMIGAIGPLIRGDHKKRSRNAQIHQEYDTLLVGHFHQLLQTKRIIVNGSLIGYNEYAYSNNFGFEPPEQALWISHPTRGITFSMPVHLDERTNKPAGEQWVSVFDEQRS